MPDRVNDTAGSRIQPDDEQRWREVRPPDDELDELRAARDEKSDFEVGQEPVRGDFDDAGNPTTPADEASMAKADVPEQPYEPPYESVEIQGQRSEDPEADTGHKTPDPRDALPEDEEEAA